jgi:hypothetical protein
MCDEKKGWNVPEKKKTIPKERNLKQKYEE